LLSISLFAFGLLLAVLCVGLITPLTAFINWNQQMPRKRRSPEYRLEQDSQSPKTRQRLDPVSVVMQSGRPTGKQVQIAYGYLNTCAKNARNNSELDEVKEADNLLFERLISTRWARKVKDAHRRISVAIRTRSNELKETES
jgi:hypothetical protein